MISGKCPHPWNKTKKGTFIKGHHQVNDGKGCFVKGHKISNELKEINSILGSERYESGIHPFKLRNKIAQQFGNKDEWYGLGKAKWKQLSKKIMQRDNFVCTRCNDNKNLNVHHIIPYIFTQDNSENNLITLCAKCHAPLEYYTRKSILEARGVVSE